MHNLDILVHIKHVNFSIKQRKPILMMQSRIIIIMCCEYTFIHACFVSYDNVNDENVVCVVINSHLLTSHL